jgi:recombinational DNA repair ATPase RecF
VFIRASLTVQSEEVDRVESQVMHLRSQVVADLEAKLAKNHQKIAQLNTDMQIEVRGVTTRTMHAMPCLNRLRL